MGSLWGVGWAWPLAAGWPWVWAGPWVEALVWGAESACCGELPSTASRGSIWESGTRRVEAADGRMVAEWPPGLAGCLPAIGGRVPACVAPPPKALPNWAAGPLPTREQSR